MKISMRYRLLLVAFAAIAAAQFARADSPSVTAVLSNSEVAVGETESGKRRPAAVSDVIKAKNYVQTETESRTELEFKDRSIVRVGQN